MGYNDDWEKLMNSVFGPQGRVRGGSAAEKPAQPPKPAAKPSGKAAAPRPSRTGGVPDLNKALQEQQKTLDALLKKQNAALRAQQDHAATQQALLEACCRYIEEHHIPHPIVYILACRIGPFAAHFQKRIHKLGGRVFLNPDGHEWMRAKWSAPVRKYWKLSEGMMVRHSDLVICDSTNIESYIHACYDGKGPGGADPRTTYIAYGAETRDSALPDDAPQYTEWLRDKGLAPGGYYLVVGRFVPENNYETMIREFIKSTSPRDFAIITNVNDKFLEQLEARLHFKNDPRIKFVGTVYDQELLKKIRENAWGYLHGHEVGGTNPSLLEALGSTDLNLLLDVGFNREVAEDAALYWTKEPGCLAALIERADKILPCEAQAWGEKAKQRVKTAYSWQKIGQEYEKVFDGR